MPSLPQRVMGYFRQLSFIAEPRDQRKINDGCFITKYLESGTEPTLSGPFTKIYNGKQPNDLPELQLMKEYEVGSDSIKIACTGPNEGLQYVKRSRLHLSAGGDIDFIDTNQDEEVRQNPKKYSRKSSTTSRKSMEQTLTVSDFKKTKDTNSNPTVEEEEDVNDLVADVPDWNMANDQGYGISISLYEKNPITNEHAGSPIADCFGMIAREDGCILALGDGVNWGEKARLASCSAVQASLEYLNRSMFSPNSYVKDTREVFVSLLRSFWEAQDFILEVGGHLTTLTVCVILPLVDGSANDGKYVVCSCNVGDSLGYIYSKTYGVREFTEGSHDVTQMRDMRDALGALGPVDGNKPELSNLTLSMTIVEKGDIVYLTSDGVSDNFDPVVGKFADAHLIDPPPVEPPKMELAPKRQNKSASSLYSRRKPEQPTTSGLSEKTVSKPIKFTSVSFSTAEIPVRPPRSKKQGTSATTITTPLAKEESTSINPRPKYTRSKTSFIEPRQSSKSSPQIQIKKSPAGLPLVTGPQRHALTLLRMADLFNYGINGILRPCTSAKKLCNLLIDFTRMITSAKRKLLEQRELFYRLSTDHTNGGKKEVVMNRMQQRAARKKVVDSQFSSLCGKLDHASVVAWTVGSQEDGTNNNNNNNFLTDSKNKMLSLNVSNIYTETDF